MKQLWISDNFLDQQLFCEVYSGYDDNIINRAYEIWNHAKNLIEQNDDTYSMSDAIWNLRRCLDQRTRTIEKNYNLKQIPLLQKPKGYYELLEYYGVARPFIVKNLFSIRNDIDHHDATPPPKERCMELLDIVWYFLKATDRILQEKKKDLFFPKKPMTLILYILVWIIDTKIKYRFGDGFPKMDFGINLRYPPFPSRFSLLTPKTA